MQYPNIDPVALNLGFIQIHWYGLMYLFGILLAWHLGKKRAQTYNLSYDDISDLVFYATLGIILGGRLGYMLFYQTEQVIADPICIIRFWEIDPFGKYQFTGLRGMSFHGGLLGVITACFYFAKKKGRHFFEITDFVAPLAPIGLALGRIGNFINGELWGRPTKMPWGMVFPFVDNQPRHPSQLYEFFLEGIVLFAILFIYSRKPRPLAETSSLFLLGYGLFRFSIEFFREPDFDQGFIAFGWLTKGQLLCLPMLLFGVMLWVYYKHFSKEYACNNI